jgi:hydroxypyruvate isomerase
MSAQRAVLNSPPTRRHVLRAALGVAGATAAAAGAAPQRGKLRRVVKKGRVKQSIVQWCFEKYWDIEQMARIAATLGCRSVELVPPKDWPVLRKYGLVCAIASIDMSPDPPFVKGFNNPAYWPKLFKVTREAIDACAEYRFPNVIAFTGMREDIPDDVGLKNCIKGLKKIIGYAEKKGVNICLEILNTRDDTHPMKGHPGYQGDHVDYCMEIVKGVGSARMKLLFDVYHVQIMDGDLIRRIRQYKDYIGHIHLAGNPGRGELDDRQEINFKPVIEALVEVGYNGYVAHEYIPTRDPLEGLIEAVKLCDV